MPPRIAPLNPVGRPPKIADVLGFHEDEEGKPDHSRPITRADRIVSSIRAGNYIEAAAPAAGVDKTTVYEWMHIGANLAAEIHKGKKRLSDLRIYERRCLEFSHAVAQASAQWEVESNLALDQLARGGLTVTSTRTKTAIQKGDDGKDHREVIEETVTTETLLPDSAVIRWRLERKYMDRYGRRQIEVSGPDGKPVPVEMVRSELLAKAAQLRGEDEEEGDAGPGLHG